MPTTITKTIGTGGDYTSPQAWEDALPANLVTADEVHVGQLKNQTFSGSGTQLVIDGHTTDATRYIELTCEAGASFKDQADVRTVRLEHDTTNGAAIAATGGYAEAIALGTNYTRLTGLQLQCVSGSSSALHVFGGQNCLVSKCILKATAGSALRFSTSSVDNKIVNSLFQGAVWVQSGTGHAIYGCTAVGSGTFLTIGSYSSVAFTNCAIFGFAVYKSGGGTATATYTATDLPALSGTGNVVNLSFADQFQTTTNDFRAKSTSGIRAGSYDGTNTPDDITGGNRNTATPTMGAWEVTWDEIKTIGVNSSPRVPDYTTLQSWEDACPADLKTANQRWVGECLDQGEFVASGNLLTISGQTVDITRYVLLQCRQGHSFKDKPDVRSKALTYNASNGVAMRSTGSYSDSLVISTNYTRIEGVQWTHTSGSSARVVNTFSAADFTTTRIAHSLLKAAAQTFNPFGGCNCWNCLLIGTFIGRNVSCKGCTVINAGGGTNGIMASYLTVVITNTAIFGFASPMPTEGGGTFTGSNFNATDAASLPAGANNKLNLNPLAQFASWGTDFRAAPTGHLFGGSPDLANTPADITGAGRSLSQTWIGCWEVIPEVKPSIIAVLGGFDAQDNPLAENLDLENLLNREDHLSKGLVAYYAVISQHSGDVLFDIAGKNHGRLTNGVRRIALRRGTGGFGSLSYDGVDDYTQIPNSSALTPGTGDFTASIWLLAKSTDIAAFAQDSWDNGWTLGINGGAQFAAYIDGTTFLEAGAVTFGVWYHLCLVRASGVPSGTVLYLNGEPIASSTDSSNLSSTGRSFLGARRDATPEKFWSGLLDEARYYNRALSAIEVRELASRRNQEQYNYIPSPVWSDERLAPTVFYVAAEIPDFTPTAEDLDLENLLNREDNLNKGLVSDYAVIPQHKGTVLFDLAGKNNGQLLNDISRVGPSGRPGGYGALKLGGTDGYVSLSSPVDLPGEMTALIWLNTGDATATQAALFQGLSDGTFGQYCVEVGRTDNKLTILWGDAIVSTSSVFSVLNNQWCCVGFTRSGATGNWTCRTYFNGQLDTTTSSITTNPGGVGSSVFLIGRRAGGTSEVFGGLVDCVELFNRALSPSEVAQRFQASRTFFSEQYNYIQQPVISQPLLVTHFYAFAYLDVVPLAEDLDLENPLNSECPLNGGLLGRWVVLPSTSGGVLFYDLTPRKMHATLTMLDMWRGPNSRPGGFGSLRCTSSPRRVAVTAFRDGFNSLTGFSGFGWFRHDEVVNSEQFGFEIIDTEGGFDRVGITRVNSGNLWRALIEKLAVGVFTADMPMPNGWFFGGFTWNPLQGITVYANGVPGPTTATPGITAFNSSNRNCHITFGGTNGAASWEGPADDFSIYSRCLSAVEVKRLFENGKLSHTDEFNYIPQAVVDTVQFTPSPSPPVVGGTIVFSPYYYYEFLGRAW
jgi:hypothetical protein